VRKDEDAARAEEEKERARGLLAVSSHDSSSWTGLGWNDSVRLLTVSIPSVATGKRESLEPVAIETKSSREWC
jgi:hypothetical protein